MKYTVKRGALGILVLATLAVVAAVAGEDIDGWQGTKWGMTPDEVQRVLSYPTSVADLASVCGEKCDEGAALQLDDYDLSGQHFMVRFWFTKPEMRLHAVSMYAKPSGDASDKGGFTKIKDYLQAVYGLPQSVGLNRGRFVYTWPLPSTTVTLNSNAPNQTTIVYEEKTGKAGGGS